MAARAIGSGTISFGLVAIPIKLFSTTDTTKAIHFNYLSTDGSRLKQQYIRASDGQIVEREGRVQGYEFAKGQYETFTPDEIKAMNVESTNAIEITEFIPLKEVERLYIEKVYFMGPDKGAARSYHLLKQALKASERAALAKYAARGKSYLVLVRPMGDGLVMEQLKHHDEMRSIDEVPLDVCELDDAELDLALKIIEQRVNDKFEPEKYQDEVRSRMLELIEQKIDGQEISVPPEEKAEAKIIDLMEALRASVGAKSSKSAAAGKRKPARAAAKNTDAGRSRPSGSKAKQSKT
ncbi:MAG: Ku protein [Proteobacteria bacterium]|nr:Ku protein [Pseudomonadota bacterium]